MDFERVISLVVTDLDHAGIRFALIGGMAMAFRGVQRTTLDLDFILDTFDLQHKITELQAIHGKAH